MNKKFYSILAILLAGILLLAACGEGDDDTTDDAGGDEPETEETDDATEEEEDDDAAADGGAINLQMGTGGTGGTYYPLGGEMATVINNNIENFDLTIDAVATGASVENLAEIGQGNFGLGMTVHLPALDALTGDGDFHGVEIDNFGFMGHIYPEIMQIVTQENSGIESIEDLRGKTVNTGPVGSGTRAAARLILEAYGLEEGDYTESDEGFGEAAGRIQDGSLDASFGLLGLPASGIEQLAAQRDIRMISISSEAMEYIEANSGYEAYEIPADAYDFLEEPVVALTAYAILVGSTDLVDEDLGYEITKALFENRDQISHAQGAHLTKENALLGHEGLPMHPGAERYFQEAGLLD
ncbi:TAXI family TRAP transporter solute-binding subunit [Evansella cellulosilytica]|uniref:TRAP transporter solute receptor, TAXI family n=1 Tax=Evansella cellulosilytica (strain ATCC 21833 / DSM 2522 / FERM P-1141 / JCM 9156 / N-4) TaxID=649639 RepID=E6TY09_EVAC2|nr:TAXI family TRAP transporter solute-binding subunit [Evansella cellulosilytica]ADU31222.1 TRAP transporter solute receptor, TAXI family [Evansella cellulosilytica DSM 2522]